MASIEQQLAAFAKTKRFQQLCDEAKKECAKTGRQFGSGGLTSGNALAVAESMREILRGEVQNIRNVHGEAFLDYILVGDPVLNSDGSYTVHVGFDRDKMHRDSVSTDPKWADGIENIALLFTTGYDAEWQISGKDRHGNWIKTLTHRDGDDFMQRAVDYFNEVLAGQAVAFLDEQYQ